MKHIMIVKIIVKAYPGRSEADCIDSAIRLSLKSDSRVMLDHNNKVFVVNPIEIRRAVMKSSGESEK